MNAFREHWKFFVLLALIIFSCFVWYAVAQEKRNEHMTVAFLNIGQGDAIYIESPTNNQLIIDGGPPRTILGEVRKVIPFYDRTIDMLVVTNPDKDHIAGFIDILRNYKIEKVIEPGTVSQSDIYKELLQSIQEEPAEKMIAERNQVIDLGGGAYLHILFPDRNVSGVSTNDGSIIAQLVYGSSTLMFTGDAPISTLEYVTDLEGASIDSDILKAGHHGSRTSASEKFISAVSPEYVVISAGKDNSYGHPHKETMELFQKLKIPTLITSEEGTIVFQCSREKCVLK